MRLWLATTALVALPLTAHGQTDRPASLFETVLSV